MLPMREPMVFTTLANFTAAFSRRQPDCRRWIPAPALVRGTQRNNARGKTDYYQVLWT
jgi:hypothetical protein